MILHPVVLAIGEPVAETAEGRVEQQRRWARRALARCARLTNLHEIVVGEGGSDVDSTDAGARPDGGDPRWSVDAAGVPIPWRGWQWSIAHCKRWTAAVIDDQAVGIDVESIHARRDGAIHEIASSEEIALFRDESWPTFFRIWTAKEAVLKAIGLGLAGLGETRVVAVESPTRVRVAHRGVAWAVEQFMRDDLIVAVATQGRSLCWYVDSA